MIRFAIETDIPNIMKFIHDHWRNDHILANNESFFKYFCSEGETINMVISVENSQINGMLGYISYNENELKDISPMMWKVVNTNNPRLGIDIFNFLTEQPNIRLHFAPGLNDRAIQFHNYIGNKTGVMNHWFRLNRKFELDKFKLARIKNSYTEKIKIKQYELKEFFSFCDFESYFNFYSYDYEKYKPYKSPDYIKKRYFDFPVYKYRVFGIINKENKINTILVFRVQECNNSFVLRFIDCIGNVNEIKNVTESIDSLLFETNSEYVDFYEIGLSNDIMSNSGWNLVKDSNNIIPNYFTPFVQENIEINYYTSEPNIPIFKGDGDQDRPY